MTTENQQDTTEPDSQMQSENDDSQQSGQDLSEGQTTDQNSNGAPSASDNGQQSPFSHPLLRGRSPEQIERIVQTLEGTVQQQSQALNQAFAQQQTQQPSGGDQTSDALPSDDDFWNTPAEATRRLVRKELEEVIAPFRQDMMQSRAEQAWTQARNHIPDFQAYEPYVRQLVAQNQLTSPTLQNLQQLFYMAKGYIDSQGGGPAPQQNQQPPAQQQDSGANRPAPPQHRPSNRPLPQNRNQNPPQRPLTEAEKTLARQYFPELKSSEAEARYRELQDAHPDEVLTTGVENG